MQPRSLQIVRSTRSSAFEVVFFVHAALKTEAHRRPGQVAGAVAAEVLYISSKQFPLKTGCMVAVRRMIKG